MCLRTRLSECFLVFDPQMDETSRLRTSDFTAGGQKSTELISRLTHNLSCLLQISHKDSRLRCYEDFLPPQYFVSNTASLNDNGISCISATKYKNRRRRIPGLVTGNRKKPGRLVKTFRQVSSCLQPPAPRLMTRDVNGFLQNKQRFVPGGRATFW